MVTSAKMVASELRVPVVRPFFGYRSYQFLRAAGAPVGGAAGGGPCGTQKLIFVLLARTFHENIFEAKASRKPCENLAKTSQSYPKSLRENHRNGS